MKSTKPMNIPKTRIRSKNMKLTQPMDPFRIWANILNSTNGRFFTVIFVKKNGARRKLNGRIRQWIDPMDNSSHIIVWDAQKQGYRKINPRTIIAFKCADFVVGDFAPY